MRVTQEQKDQFSAAVNGMIALQNTIWGGPANYPDVITNVIKYYTDFVAQMQVQGVAAPA